MRVDEVDVVTGDTDQFYWGAGTCASRGAVVAGNAVHQAATAVRTKILKTASEHFECAEADLVIEDGKVSIVGVPGRAIALGDLAGRANPMRGAVRAGAQAMIVEIDPETMMLKILKFAMVHDCGTVINPLIVEGQVQGGIAQGIGNPFFEKLVYDGEGQLLNASLADYLLPTSLDVPHIELEHTVTPSPLNPQGIKGMGEAGAIPVGPLYAQAIEDALGLPDTGVEILEIPLGPGRLWESQRKIEISITQIAEAEGLDLGRASRIARLAQLAPDIVEACATGVAAHLTLENVGRRANPLRWDEQRERPRFR